MTSTDMTSTQQPEETPGGSTISDPEVFNDPADTDAFDKADNADNDDDELDAPDPS
jgi:hypothetical protein